MDRHTFPVPHFALFGEHTGNRAEDMVHCETIAIRSRLYDWEISPHRHPALCQMLLVLAGTVDLTLGGHGSQRSGPLLLIAPSGTVHGFRFAPETRGMVLSLSDRFVDGFAKDDPACALLASPDAIALEPDEAGRLMTLGEQMLLSHREGPTHDRIRRALAEAFIRIAAEQRPDNARRHGDALVRRFQQLVRENMRRQRAMSDYAAQLNCTGRTLSRRVRAALGVSPAQYLHDRIVAEATRLLRFTNGTCEEIANELGFADASYFSRFYRRIAGRSPGAVKRGL